MWISELSERTRIPVDTIKHYLRIGVLPKGRPIGPLRAEYDEEHARRLILVKALTDVGRLSLDQIRTIFDSIDEEETSLRNAVGVSHLSLSMAMIDGKQPSEESLEVVDDLLARHGWEIEPESTHRFALAVAIDTLASVQAPEDRRSERLAALLDAYAEQLLTIARKELDSVDLATRHTTVMSVVIGTVLFEPLVLLIRRLAHQQASRDWFAEERWRELPQPEADGRS